MYELYVKLLMSVKTTVRILMRVAPSLQVFSGKIIIFMMLIHLIKISLYLFRYSLICYLEICLCYLYQEYMDLEIRVLAAHSPHSRNHGAGRDDRHYWNCWHVYFFLKILPQSLTTHQIFKLFNVIQ